MTDLEKPVEKLAMCRTRVQQLETCHQINSLLSSEFDLGSLLVTIMDTAKKVMDADASSLLLLDEESGDLVFQVALGGFSKTLKTLARLPIGKGIAGLVAQTGESLIIKDAYQHPQFNPDYDKKTGFKTGSILCAPLKSKGKVIGVCQVIHGRDKGEVFTGPDLGLFEMFCSSAALAVQNAKMHQILMEKQRWEKDIEFAKSVQESFLPPSAPEHNAGSFAAVTVPAREVGGDYYDFFWMDDDNLSLVVGDVSGKGVPAALQMARLMSDFRYLSQVHTEPCETLADVNEAFCSRSYRGMFTTAVYLTLDLKTKKVKVSNAGHHSMMVLSEDGKTEERGKASGAPLGVLPGSQFTQEEFSLKSGDRVLIYTDGVIEPRNPAGEEFGLERLTEIAARNGAAPDALIADVQKELSAFTEDAPQFDDLTLVAFQVK